MFYYAEPEEKTIPDLWEDEEEDDAELNEMMIDKTHPLIVEDLLMSQFEGETLIEWATEYPKTAKFDEFTIEAMNHDGFYVPINCEIHTYME